MIFVWLAIWAVVVMILTTLSISITSRFYQDKSLPLKPVCFISGVVLTLVALISALFFADNLKLVLPITALFFILVLFLWLELKMSGWQKEVLIFLLCIGSTFLLPAQATLIVQWPAWAIFPLLGLELYCIVRLFTIMDRVPDLSLMTLLAQGVLLLLLMNHHILSTNLIYGLFYFFVASMSVTQTVKAFGGRSVLGSFAAPVAGFIMGFLWIYMAAWGHIFIPAILYSYDMMELALAGSLTLIHTRRFYPLITPFLLEQAQEKNFKPKRLNRLIFFILVAFSFTAFLYLTRPELLKSMLILLLLLLLYIYMRLKKWGIPKPTFRDLKVDLKAGFAELKKQLMYIPLKKDTQKAKVAVQTVTEPKKQPVVRKKSATAKRTKK